MLMLVKLFRWLRGWGTIEGGFGSVEKEKSAGLHELVRTGGALTPNQWRQFHPPFGYSPPDSEYGTKSRFSVASIPRWLVRTLKKIFRTTHVEKSSV